MLYRLSKENIEFSGTLCFDCDWNDNTKLCEYKRENNCGFCIFMKGGPCRNTFKAWESCVDAVKEGEEKDEEFAKRCQDQTINLWNCTKMFPDYYMKKEEEDE
eukprot:snap_masked-scaffold_2-processed-gene-22.21-mRNA-1 protein AED:1.00 eAED:1.00 QI:0/-1/0/0/-1/1/1/0/102